ncbi:MAG: c-type cytochrome [Cyclobacteriaceae bacterium]
MNTIYFLITRWGALALLLTLSFNLQAQEDLEVGEDPNYELPENVQEAVDPAQEVPDEIPVTAQAVANGRDLFAQHCNVCHMVEKQLIGPALASVHNRRPIPWLLAFIKNSQYVINETDDEYAQHLFEQYNGQIMPQFEFLSNEDIYDILSYIKAESVSPTATGGVNGANSEAVQPPQDEYTDDEATTDQNYSYGDDQSLNDNYTFNEGGAEAESEMNAFANVSIVVLILIGLSIVAVILVLIYVIRARKKLKEKQKA